MKLNRLLQWMSATLCLLLGVVTASAQSPLTSPSTWNNQPQQTQGRSLGQMPGSLQRSGSETGGLLIPTTDKALLYPSPSAYHLVPGDLITVSIYGVAYQTTARVDEASRVKLPLLGSEQISGMSIQDAETFLAHRFVEAQLFRSPEVSINLLESPTSNATVYGEVNSVVPVLSNRRLIDVIIAAGGLPPTASHIVTINRAGASAPLVINMGDNPYTSPAANIPVMPGDSVFINREGIVYVVGAFRQQGMLTLTGNHQMTLMEAAALSGGPDPTVAKYDDLHLIRTINGKRTVVVLDIKKVLYGKEADPILQADDIVFLPTSGAKMVFSNGTVNAIVSAASLAISLLSVTR
ncbi:polysaccharide biosynthesis/export family protein [Granulicella cerasi]|uniref:Polysaccharide biosynthesis/export family protein n=1 Tax=Granulicella cerasi TaxID=741063 RepID=A0ABW1Z7A5_9BACT|nr:polysaccharide biosynthesis/export family protein [Granulicella cerasi]